MVPRKRIITRVITTTQGIIYFKSITYPPPLSKLVFTWGYSFSYFKNLEEPEVSMKEMVKNQRLRMQLLDFFNFESHDYIPERILRIF